MIAKEMVVDGVVNRWLESGEGPPIVLVHGIPTSPRLWRHVVPLLGGRALCWEMRGYGTSIGEGRDSDIGLAAQAGYLLSWLNALELPQPPVLVGHDLGGGVAQIAAVRSPGSFAGIMLTNAVSYDSWPIPRVKAMTALAPVMSRLPESMIYPSFVQLLHQGHDDRQRALESIAQHWPPYVVGGAAPAMIRQMSALRTSDTMAIAGQLPALGLPAAVVWGDADRFQKIEYGERLAADLGAQFTRIGGGKHFTPEDHPAEVAAAINGLLG